MFIAKFYLNLKQIFVYWTLEYKFVKHFLHAGGQFHGNVIIELEYYELKF